ncbi:MAG: hypothetical protein LBD51_00935 [Bifidobacteriaceae bacterium]|jgi:hypothetical protein|nr:hypothetical protein [Bifidobacteriaceae bacterium]
MSTPTPTPARPRRAPRAALAAAAAIATAAAGLLAAPAFALAPGLDPANRLGDLHLDVTSGAIAIGGGPQTLTTDWGCPAGYRRSSRVFLIWADGTWTLNGSPAPTIAKTEAGGGLDGGPITRSGAYASRWGASPFPVSNFSGHDGVATYLVTCDPGDAPDGETPSIASGVGSSLYFSVDLAIDYGTGSNTSWQAIVPPEQSDAAESDIDLDVPEEVVPTAPSGLKITVKPGATTLTGPVSRVQGTAWQATGALDNVTVSDDRRDADAPGWTLNGRVSQFTSPTTTDVIPSTNLGWTPALVAGAGAAGPAVAPGVGAGLAAERVLAYGEASANEAVETTVTAALALNVPSGVAAGSYKASLTLTLI